MGNQAGIKRDFEGMEQRRFRAAELFERGYTRAEVARMLDVTFVSARRWHLAWQNGGFHKLKKAGRAGRKSKLNSEQVAKIESELASGAASGGLLGRRMTSRRILQVIEKVTGVRYHPESISRLIRRLGWTSYRSPGLPGGPEEFFPSRSARNLRIGTEIEIDGGVSVRAA